MALEAACPEAPDHGVVSADVILNILGWNGAVKAGFDFLKSASAFVYEECSPSYN
jgi:hypothetical protein